MYQTGNEHRCVQHTRAYARGSACTRRQEAALLNGTNAHSCCSCTRIPGKTAISIRINGGGGGISFGNHCCQQLTLNSAPRLLLICDRCLTLVFVSNWNLVAPGCSRQADNAHMTTTRFGLQNIPITDPAPHSTDVHLRALTIASF